LSVNVPVLSVNTWVTCPRSSAMASFKVKRLDRY
jgi:hypothetical protein